MGTGKSRGGTTRRAVLVIGGVTLLAGYWQDPARHSASSAPAGNVHVDAAHPRPATHPTQRAHPSPAADPTRHAHPAKPPRRGRRRRRDEPGEIVYHVRDGRKGIALTIDDGPSPEYTPQVLRLLEKYKVTATFSMIGLEVAAYPGLVREVAAAGHTIANHTWSHPDLARLAPVTVADQINRATGAIHKVTGREPALFRAPYGAWSPAVLEQCLRSGMTPLDWSVDPRDWSRPGVASIVANIMRNTRTGSIILEHDGGGNRSQTIAALKIVLPRLLDAGYHFTTP
jgi:peptidoglycan/xylan/chitin deacetylase (PgdA/CDA1 family)